MFLVCITEFVRVIVAIRIGISLVDYIILSFNIERHITFTCVTFNAIILIFLFLPGAYIEVCRR